MVVIRPIELKDLLDNVTNFFNTKTQIYDKSKYQNSVFKGPSILCTQLNCSDNNKTTITNKKERSSKLTNQDKTVLYDTHEVIFAFTSMYCTVARCESFLELQDVRIAL